MNIPQHRLFRCICLLLLCPPTNQGMAQQRQHMVITIRNVTRQNRDSGVVAIPFEGLAERLPLNSLGPFKLINTADQTEVPYQLEYRGNLHPVNLLVRIGCLANSAVLITVKAGKQAPVRPMTYARFVPERFDDFAWENDRVAHRMYGPALEARKDNAFGIDVWSKRTPRLILNKWYKMMDFDTDHGEGLDYYGVGKTLGAGDIAPYLRDTIYFTHNFTAWKILDNGPLRSTFRLSYPARDLAGHLMKVTKTISIDAGSQMSKVEAVFEYDGDSELPVVIGIAKRMQPGVILFNEREGFMGYWEPENPLHGTTGLGCIFTKPVKEMKVGHNHLLTFGSTMPGQPFVYYTGSAWSKGGFIKNDQEWFSYLASFSNDIKFPLEVKL